MRKGLVFLLTVIASYLITAYALWDLDASNWESLTRVFQMLAGLVMVH
jgi:hypothetical protein